MSCQFDLALQMMILVLEDGGFLDYFLGLNFIFFLIYLIIESILLKGKNLYIFANLLQLPFFIFHLLLKLQLSIEQLVMNPFEL